jgi:hypothetical protein
MLHDQLRSGGHALVHRRRRSIPLARIGALSAVLTAGLAGLSVEDDASSIAPTITTERAAPPAETVAVGGRSWTLDPSAPEVIERVERPVDVPAQAAQEEHAPSAPAQASAAPVRMIPLPVPRPAELGTLKPARRSEVASGPVSQGRRSAAIPVVPADNRSYIEKLFGVEPTPGTALSYAALQTPGLSPLGPQLSPSPNPAATATAVYDVSAKLVYMPNGERLEAHSGLGEKLDDARYVHVRMRGATPPATYELTEREQPFHGVRALRLNPVGGSATVYGRAGLLAHTYMLGPNGDSNGCVSFKDYDKFLQAYLRGEVRRLVVVAGGGQDRPFSIFSRRS